jgi:multidrug resistance efflux pump
VSSGDPAWDVLQSHKEAVAKDKERLSVEIEKAREAVHQAQQQYDRLMRVHGERAVELRSFERLEQEIRFTRGAYVKTLG